ncbi:hypothetical protein J4212_02925 [Candidatus Woesearchaeota archaeon]|nr:hypothetical protein [Candidatus Woesearchaeota archaeon]
MRIKKPLAISLIFIIILSFVLAIFQKIGWTMFWLESAAIAFIAYQIVPGMKD